jgi:hypothetical protein
MADKKMRRRGMDLGRVLLWSAVVVEAPRWAGAMLAADLKDVDGWLSSALNTGNTMAGVAMGLVNVIATAYMLDALRHERPVISVRRAVASRRGMGDARGTLARPTVMVEKANWRFYGLLVFIAGLLALTPFVLAPFMVSRMTGETLATVLRSAQEQYVWAVTVVLAPIFVIGGVSFAQPGLVGMSVQNVAAVETGLPKVSAQVSEKGDGKPATYGKWKTWRKVPEAERLKIAAMNVGEVVATYGTEERTAYNWLRDARALVAADTELTTKGTKVRARK